ncbi:MAG: FixH family protein [Cytophagaceae bacterium]|nr:FixH family protein [Cytophagaceae bacterium]
MSWGYRVTIITGCFVCFMTCMVIAAFRQNFDLVTEDYYAKELQFQSQINKQMNHEQLKSSIVFKQSNESLILIFPAEFIAQPITGKILLFRPSDASKDITFKLATNGEPVHLSKKELFAGLYQVQVDYKVADKLYYFEKDITIY